MSKNKEKQAPEKHQQQQHLWSFMRVKKFICGS
jgi:hypothetical protein